MFPGDQVLEWNGRFLQGATFNEVYNIILESKAEPQVELVVSRPSRYVWWFCPQMFRHMLVTCSVSCLFSRDGSHLQLNSSEFDRVNLTPGRKTSPANQIRDGSSGSSSFDSQKVGPSISITSPMSPSFVSGQVSVSIPSMHCTPQVAQQLTATVMCVSDCEQASAHSQNSGNRRSLEE